MTVIAGLSLALNAWLVWLLVRQSGAVTVRPSAFRRVSRETPPRPVFRVPQPPGTVVEEDEEPEPPKFDRASMRDKIKARWPGKTDQEYDAAVAEIEAHGGRMLATLR